MTQKSEFEMLTYPSSRLHSCERERSGAFRVSGASNIFSFFRAPIVSIGIDIKIDDNRSGSSSYRPSIIYAKTQFDY